MWKMREKWYYRLIKIIYYGSFIIMWSFFTFIFSMSSKSYNPVTKLFYTDVDKVITSILVLSIIMLLVWYTIKWIFFYITENKSSL